MLYYNFHPLLIYLRLFSILFFGKISKFIKLNIISLRLNSYYKYNLYLLIFIFVCILSSIIVRSNIINVELLLNNNQNIIIITQILLILSSIYAFKLIFNLIKKMIQSYKIIPEFIKWYKNDINDIKSIITLYYIQNMFYMLITTWILYIILGKLNTFIEGVYLSIISIGIISSIVFLYYYPLKSFNLIPSTNIKDNSLWVYVLLLVFMLFYILILPLMIINVINSDKFMLFMNNLINDYNDDYKNTLRNIGSYMNTPSTEAGAGDIKNNIFINNNKVNSNDNKVSVPNRDKVVIDNNYLTTTGNTVEVRSNQTNNSPQSINNIGTINYPFKNESIFKYL